MLTIIFTHIYFSSSSTVQSVLISHHYLYSLLCSLIITLIYTDMYILLCVINTHCVSSFTFMLLLIAVMMSHHLYLLYHLYEKNVSTVHSLIRILFMFTLLIMMNIELTFMRWVVSCEWWTLMCMIDLQCCLPDVWHLKFKI